MIGVNSISLLGVCLCLFTGGLLGGVYLVLKILRLLLGGGRFMQAVMDVLFCLLWTLVAFICALALDKGRLRFVQVVLQIIGAWGVTASLNPLVLGTANLIRRAKRKCEGILHRFVMRPAALLEHRIYSAVQKRMPKRKLPKTKKKPLNLRTRKNLSRKSVKRS